MDLELDTMVFLARTIWSCLNPNYVKSHESLPATVLGSLSRKGRLQKLSTSSRFDRRLDHALCLRSLPHGKGRNKLDI